MQESASFTFEPAWHKSALELWEMVLAFLILAGLLCFVIWQSRRQSKNPGSLKLGGG
jgi:high-affinity Fe2+/Pb2+ permease